MVGRAFGNELEKSVEIGKGLVDVSKFEMLAAAQVIKFGPARFKGNGVVKVIEGFLVLTLAGVNATSHVVALRVGRRCLDSLAGEFQRQCRIAFLPGGLGFVHYGVGGG